MEKISEPTWEDDILPKLFSKPYWKDSHEAESIGKYWLSQMIPYLITLNNYESVCEWSETIYYHLASGFMPMHSEPFPDEACEMFRDWINQGCRRNVSSKIIHRKRPIPNTRLNPEKNEPKITVRKDILSLTEEELNHYRMQLDDVLKVGVVKDGDDITKWQKLGYLHSNWCLHYQEAFLPWHRANLLWVESQIGCRIPYWNCYAEDSSDPKSKSAGIPQAFLDEKYIHPKTKEERKNPLKYACAKDGKEKESDHFKEISTYIRRFPWLENPQKYPDDYSTWVGYFKTFHHQVKTALNTKQFSNPQNTGDPWANIPQFKIPVPDKDYNRTNLTFDNLFEQAHDNFHGFVGPDMMDNSYTAFDPVFYSLHSNIDRIFEMHLKANPTNQFSSNFPLEPFKGRLANKLAEGNPLKYLYTTVGDMVKNSKALGYSFDIPYSKDYKADSDTKKHGYVSATLDTLSNPEAHAFIEFDGVKCINSSYTIDIFLSDSDEFTPKSKPNIDQKEYFGRITRIAMGDGTDNRRCIKNGIKRVLVVEHNMLKGLTKEKTKIYQIVKNMDGTVVPQKEYINLPGFIGRLVWGVYVI